MRVRARDDAGDWTWLFRDAASGDDADSLPDAMSGANLGPDPHVWVGAEDDVVHRVRRFCETELGLGRSRPYALTYWRSNRVER
ncbi:SIP domain-containing protein [Actinopolyspora halophila]|uniref:SIP domain-containing protein n=1 Tax=Actinopolyspora halophila TaxID=1850 RepID=UPI0009FD6242